MCNHKNNVERLTVLSDGNLITPDDVKMVFCNVVTSLLENEKISDRSPSEEYHSFEKSRIFEALKQAGGNKKKAAEILGMTRTKLYRKLGKYK